MNIRRLYETNDLNYEKSSALLQYSTLQGGKRRKMAGKAAASFSTVLQLDNAS